MSATLKPITKYDALIFLNEASSYFAKRLTGGEDKAHWANVFNSENCLRVAALIERMDVQLVAERNRRADGWQPIQSAPKGEEDMILMFEPHEMGGFMFAGCWDQRGEWRNNLDSEVQKPTHWRPLPPAPAEAS